MARLIVALALAGVWPMHGCTIVIPADGVTIHWGDAYRLHCVDDHPVRRRGLS